jgi:antitoxin ParD1/3/4
MSKPVTVTLGKMAERAEAHLASGRFASMSELMREGLRALDRQEAMLDELYRAKLAEALADPRPTSSAEETFAEVRSAAKERRG